MASKSIAYYENFRLKGQAIYYTLTCDSADWSSTITCIVPSPAGAAGDDWLSLLLRLLKLLGSL